MFASMKIALPSTQTQDAPSRRKDARETRARRRQSNTDRSTGSTASASSSGSSSIGANSIPKGAAPKYMVVLDATVPVPLSAITYEMVSNVMGTWEQVRQIPNWDATAGEMFTRKIFELDPETIVMFGFPASTKYDDPKLSEDKAFMAKSIRLLKAIDVAVGCLGPDLQPLEEQLLDLGARHTAMNCRPHHWPVVGKALMHVLGVCLGDRLSSADRESWTVIYNFLSFHMVRGLLQKKPILAGTAPLPEESRIQVLTTPAPVARKNIKQRRKVSVTLDCTKEVHVNDITFEMVNHVLTSWEKGIRSIPNWSSKVGFIFLRYILKHTGSEGNKLFGYPSDTKWDDLGFENDPVFRKKGERLIQAIDMALSFMGPDLQPLEFTMKDLGRRHFHMECQPEHWPLVGEALLDVFRECMGEEGGLFTAQVEESWTTLYNFLGFHMIEGLNAEKRGE